MDSFNPLQLHYMIVSERSNWWRISKVVRDWPAACHSINTAANRVKATLCPMLARKTEIVKFRVVAAVLIIAFGLLNPDND